MQKDEHIQLNLETNRLECDVCKKKSLKLKGFGEIYSNDATNFRHKHKHCKGVNKRGKDTYKQTPYSSEI